MNGVHAGRGRRTVVLLGVVLVLIMVLVGVLIAQNSTSSADPADPTGSARDPASSSAPPPSPSPPSSPSSPSTPAPQVPAQGAIDDDTAQTLLETYVTAVAEIAPDAEDVPERIDAVAGETIIAELEAELLELDSNGWTRTGSAVVDSASVIDQDSTATPPVATVHACIDSSEVRVLDSAGAPLPQDPSAARAVNIYTLHQVDGAWVIVSRTFGDDPAC
ncbi:hypothetical protein [Ruania halotolerans]|uniref:hypothetical protein n=1 Tax=Ruania halotolerans TaxID=2897773 RepID=UPI001E4C564D|nr:hypothetical protein [Ruania halotolerans]UFU05726.1 hypothetical protein LQF10_14975 [Ruania halotolerans]